MQTSSTSLITGMARLGPRVQLACVVGPQTQRCRRRVGYSRRIYRRHHALQGPGSGNLRVSAVQVIVQGDASEPFFLKPDIHRKVETTVHFGWFGV